MNVAALSFRLVPATQLVREPHLSRRWDELNARRLDLPFHASAAVGIALEVFGNGREQLVIGETDGAIRCMFVVQRDAWLKWRTFRPSQMPLSAWVAEQGLQLQELARVIQSRALPACLVFSVTEVDPLAAPRLANSLGVSYLDYIPTAWLQLEGSFETYWAERGKNLRQNMKKQRNKLAAEGVQAELRVLTKQAEMQAAVARYGQLESAGWKSSEGTAVHADNSQGRFYTKLFEELAARDECVVFEYLFNGRTVAMDLCLRRAGLLVVLKTAYDEGVGKSLSPAALMREDELKWLFADSGIKRVEYYGRVMEWHTKLTDKSRVLHHLTSYRWNWVHALAQRRRRTAEPTGATQSTSPAEAEVNS